MGDKVRIAISDDPGLVRLMWTVNGIAMALAAMDEVDGIAGKLPGAVLLRAKVEQVMAEERIALSTATLKRVAKAGHDISKCKQVLTVFEGGEAFLEVEAYDLADMAEGT